MGELKECANSNASRFRGHPSLHRGGGRQHVIAELFAQRELLDLAGGGVRQFIDERDVKEVVAENPVPPEIIALMRDVLGVDGTDVDGVTVWEVPATGATPHEAPPTSQVITTAPSG